MVQHLIPLTDDPQVHETARPDQHALVTPNEAFFVRNHFAVPRLNPSEWRLHLEGQSVRSFTLADLRAMPARTLPVTLECAGNSRTYFSRPTEGVKFTHGGISHAEWRGVSLRDVLQQAGLVDHALEIWMRGADQGQDSGHALAYERSLPLAKALHPDTLLAYEMNGQALAAEHGAPVRAIVPGWYGMASVKWLTEIKFLNSPYKGFYQHDRYRYERPGCGEYQESVDRMRVKSLIFWPRSKDAVQTGAITVRGAAWAGEQAVARVRVSCDDGQTWAEAQLTERAQPFCWVHWTFNNNLPPGSYTLLAQAFDSAGNAQALTEDWNYRGYGNNTAQPVHMTVIL